MSLRLLCNCGEPSQLLDKSALSLDSLGDRIFIMSMPCGRFLAGPALQA